MSPAKRKDAKTSSRKGGVVYLDNNATTTVAPEALEAMLPYFTDRYGNPSSAHRLGLDAERGLKASRRTIAQWLGVDENEVVFTSGATESDNLAIRGAARARKRLGRHIVTTTVEHDAVHETCRALRAEGFTITEVAADLYGNVSPDAILSTLREDTILVAVIHVQNELGTIEPIEGIARAVKQNNPNILVFSDGAQAFGKMPIDLTGIDLYAVSGHKVHAPKGVGALVIRNGIRIEPLCTGGGQEQGIRPGTENVAGAAAFAKATDLAYGDLSAQRARLRALRERFMNGIRTIERIRLNSPDGGIETTVNAAFLGIPSEVLLHALEARGIFASAGSACSARSHKRSRALDALPLPDDVKHSSIRFSFSRYTIEEEIDAATAALHELVPELRKMTER